MVKHTTTLLEYISSELQKKGKNEFFNDDQLTFFSHNHSFIRKCMHYDEDVEKIMNDKIFNGFKLIDLNVDRGIKRAFLNRFLNREIGFQTIEMFSSEITYMFIVREGHLNTFAESFHDFVTGGATTESKDRSAHNSLPQDSVNVNINDDTLVTADYNDVSNNTSFTKRYDITQFLKTDKMLHNLFNEIEERCFLNVW